MILSICNSPQLSHYDISSLSRIISGAAPLPDGVAKQVMKKLNVRLYQGELQTAMCNCSLYTISELLSSSQLRKGNVLKDYYNVQHRLPGRNDSLRFSYF